MLYIALATTSLLTLFYGIAYNEQIHKTSIYRSKVNWLLRDNKILQEKLDKLKREQELDKLPLYRR